MNNTNRKSIKNSVAKGVKWYTVEETFKTSSKTQAHKRAYEEQTERIKLARKIREVRMAKKLTQSSVAKKADMPQSVIARLESGSHSVSFETLNKVVRALGKRIEVV